MKFYKIVSSLLLLSTLLFAYLFFDASRTDPIEKIAVEAASSSVSDLAYNIEDITISFETFHSESNTRKEEFFKRTLLSRSLQKLNSNQRLMNTAEHSSLLTEEWFQKYNNALFTMRSILTLHSFENEHSDQADEIIEELQRLQAEVEEIVNQESFTIQDPKTLSELTQALTSFNDSFTS
ncbi:hypothetical protein [Halobacillus litoralis]|uniref:hypothetical protein n=1 Tax=Halobacillus litoralis TaxID=45668 RepID=UPI001CFE0FEE|nr:hypothetical protein [Halobacillus litoralis]